MSLFNMSNKIYGAWSIDSKQEYVPSTNIPTNDVNQKFKKPGKSGTTAKSKLSTKKVLNPKF